MRTRSAFALCLISSLLCGRPAFASGDGATRFDVFVPPNAAYASRASFLIVTSISAEPNLVDIEDDDADGDDDDSALGVVLTRGQSQIVRIADGTVDDDRGGIRDGDFFRVRAQHPVVVQIATQSNWQHDWAPSESGRALGSNFFIYAPPTSGADNDMNVFAYSDGTELTVTDVTSVPSTASGTTSVDLEAGVPVLSVLMHEGEDLIHRRHRLGLDILDPGHTYWVRSSKPVALQYGHLGQVTGGNQARDGGGFVPSANGSTSGSLFYFAIPHNPGRESEKELRVVCFDGPTTLTLSGATAHGTGWAQLDTMVLDAGEHADFVGATHAAFRDHDLYRLEASPPYHRCTTFEGNWLETGSFGTSDYATAVSAAGGGNIGHQFVAYLGPPGAQGGTQHPPGELTNDASPGGGYFSHLYIYPREGGANVTVRDVDTDGQIFEESFSIPADRYFDLVVDTADYNALSSGGVRPYLRVDADAPVAVVSGNFNDNWMAYLHSTQEAGWSNDITLANESVACGGQVQVQVSCELEPGASLSGAEVTLSFDPALQVGAVTSADGPGSSSAGALAWTLGAVDNGRVFSATVDLDYVCGGGGGCESTNLSTLSLECSGTTASEPSSRVESRQLSLVNPAQTSVDRFIVRDLPDYEGATPQPRTEVDVQLSGGEGANSSARLFRAIGNPDPSAPQTLIAQWTGGDYQSGLSELASDPYNLHHEETRYYRLELDDGSCTQVVGPVAVQTSSGYSGGVDAGLESNGRLASALARRKIGRLRSAPWLHAERALAAWGVQMETRSGDDQLASLAPTQGPRQSEPVAGTPGDLPDLTNAEAVFAADYLAPSGEWIGGVLMVETRGQPYEHSRPLCERASGSELTWWSREPFGEGQVLRMATANEQLATGSYAVEFDLIFEEQGGVQVRNAWVLSDLANLPESWRVVRVQAWATRAGDELALAEDLLSRAGASWDVVPDEPPAVVTQLSALGGEFEASLMDWAGGPHSVRLRQRDESGEWVVVPHRMDDGRIVAENTAPGMEWEFEILGEDGEVVDRTWASDGAWALLDDNDWGGESHVEGVELGACEAPRAVDGQALALSGCAKVNAQVDDFVGLARHFGGSEAPLDLRAFESVSFEVSNDRALLVCAEQPGNAAGSGCIRVPAGPARQLELPLAEFRRLGTCEAVELDSVHLMSWVANERGAVSLSVSGLGFGAMTDERAADYLPCAPESDAARARGGCSVTAERPRGRALAWILIIAWLGVPRRRRRRDGGKRVA